MTIADLKQSGVRRKKWSGAEYDRLVELGVFDHQRVELIEGEVLEMSPMNDPHVKAVVRTQYQLLKAFPPDASTVLVQCALRLEDDDRPEPDVSVIDVAPNKLSGRPTSALLVVEVSDSTLEYDRKVKAPLYAKNGIQEYWIINLIDRCVEVFRNPRRDFENQRYAEIKVFASGETFLPLSAPAAAIAVADLLP